MYPSLREAVAELVAAEGLLPLERPNHFVAYVTDVIDTESIEATVLYEVCDGTFLRSFSSLSDTPTTEALRRGVQAAAGYMVREHGKDAGIANRISWEIGAGVADALGLVAPPFPSSRPATFVTDGLQPPAQPMAPTRPVAPPAEQPVPVRQLPAQSAPPIGGTQPVPTFQSGDVPMGGPIHPGAGQRPARRIWSVVAVLIAVSVVVVVAWMTVRNGDVIDWGSSTGVSVQPDQLRTIREHMQTKDGSYVEVVEVQNQSGSTCDVTISFEFVDASDRLVESKSKTSYSIGPGERTLIFQSSVDDDVEDVRCTMQTSGPKYGDGTVSSVLSVTEVSRGSKRYEVRLENTGSHAACLMSCVVCGRDGDSIRQLDSQVLPEDNQTIEPGEDVSLSFAGNWKNLDCEVYLYGYLVRSH